MTQSLLSKRERNQRIYELSQTTPPMTQAKIAERFGISRERVRQIVSKHARMALWAEQRKGHPR